jgi:hypothetical protein
MALSRSLFIMFLLVLPSEALAQQKTLNETVKAVVEDFVKNRSHGGYDINQAFTRDLNYGPTADAIKSTGRGQIPRQTMCVAATAEIIIETLDLYYKSHSKSSLFDNLPLNSWTSGKLTSARANIFMYSGTGSRGTGYTLEMLGIGKEKTFDKLNSYDFVNLNRRGGSGHSVTFISYLGKDYNELDHYIPDEVVGFKYFSAQGKSKPDAGFAYRYAYFGDYCPAFSAEKPRDCGVIKSLSNLALLDGGELWDPSEWRTEEAHNRLLTTLRRSIEDQYGLGASRGLIDSVLQTTLDTDLQPSSDRFTGETTD